jgi:uncharacterized protein
MGFFILVMSSIMSIETVFAPLEKLFCHLSFAPHKTYPELHGLFYAIALTPFRITETEVLPLLFVQKQEFSALQLDDLLKTIGEISQIYPSERTAKTLLSPVAEGQTQSTLVEWIRGFYQGLQLRSAFWQYENDGVTENEPVRNSLAVLAQCLTDETRAQPTDSQLVEAITAIEAFAQQVRTEAAMAQQKLNPPVYEPVKTGRNDPCPCGSGKKFKKCCAH